MRGTDEALIVIDVQNDFCPGGALAVAGGDAIIPRINALMAEFSCVVLTQDWHPADHASFAANHPGAAPFSLTEMPYGPQVLWPTHCVQGTAGAAFHPDLKTDPAQLVIRKGFSAGIDSYSAFFENDKTTATGLHGYLTERAITSVTLVGLATDFCVGFRRWTRHGWVTRSRFLKGLAGRLIWTAALSAPVSRPKRPASFGWPKALTPAPLMA